MSLEAGKGSRLRRKRWVIAPPLSKAQLAQYASLPPLLAQVLHNRGIRTPAEGDEFLHPDSMTANPFQFEGMHKAVARIRQALRARQPIVVYGDYDVDGVTATALLVQMLKALGGRVWPYIPHRVNEGYGLNVEAIEKIARFGAKLVITVDCGIRSVDEAAHARRMGVDMIITEPHSVGPALPLAAAVIDPKQPARKYPFPELAGVGLAFKVAQALLRVERQMPARGKPTSSLPAEEDLLDLVALGTVADVVPLLGENRGLVRQGLRQLNEAKRAGIRAMLQEAGIAPGRVTATTIGYVLGPRLNAAGRLADASVSYKLLMTTSEEEARALAEELGQRNRERQQLTQKLWKQAETSIMEEGIGPILIVRGKEYLAGVAGLVAGRLTERFCRPSVVVEQGDKESKAAARSIPEFHITNALDRCADLLMRYGGHAQAAGFTIRNENWGKFTTRLRAIAAEELDNKELLPAVNVDAEIPLSQADWAVTQLLAQLEPFGHKNPVPIFASHNVIVRRYRVVGENHLQLTVSDGRVIWDAIAFGQGEWAEDMPPHLDIAYSLSVDEWNGRKRLKLLIEDLRPAESRPSLKGATIG